MSPLSLTRTVADFFALMTTVTLCTVVFCIAVGIAVLWANPQRFSNQTFSVASLLIAGWLAMVYAAMKTGIHADLGEAVSPIPWYRANAALAAFFPAIVWLLKESILATEDAKWRTIKRTLPWVGLGLLLATLCYSDSFVTARTAHGAYQRGSTYVVYNAVMFLTILLVITQSWLQMRAQTGIQRIEMQFLTLTYGGMSLSLALFNTAGNLLHIRALNRASIPLVFCSYALTAWAITVHRIFDARQVFLGLSQRLALPLLLALGIWGSWKWSESFLSPSFALFFSLVFWSSTAFWLDRKSREWLRIGGDDVLAEERGAVIAIARREPHPDLLVEKFEALLCERGKTSFAALLFDHGKSHAAGNLNFAKARLGFAVLCDRGWATPENLQRRRPTPGNEDLRLFLGQNSLGLLVAVPRGSPAPSFVLALGTKTSRKPFTYPEVQRIQNVGELMDNILAHSRLTAQAALKAKMEHLALMSRGLAHDLKNLITPISTFILHTDGQFERNSPEGDVHTAAKRSVHIITDYVREALFFASKLTPNFESTDLATVLETVRVLVVARAAGRGVDVVIHAGERALFTADSVLLQRLLVNLVNNAIDASASGTVVTIRCVPRESGRIRVEVVDQGCGIAPENLERIFEPYFTTKHFGDDVRGFGLGLTICEKIVHLHQGTISVQSEVGRGTRVLVELPATPSAFAPSRQDAVPS